MKHSFKLALATAFAAGTFVVAGCSSTVDEVTNSVDCHQVCQRYADCFQADYDVDGCTDKCEHSADASAERERKLKMCDDCIDNKSCAATFSCADQCLGIVP